MRATRNSRPDSERQHTSNTPHAHAYTPLNYHERGLADHQGRSKAEAHVLGRARRRSMPAVLVGAKISASHTVHARAPSSIAPHWTLRVFRSATW